jgi:hypothetical protein
MDALAEGPEGFARNPVFPGDVEGPLHLLADQNLHTGTV